MPTEDAALRRWLVMQTLPDAVAADVVRGLIVETGALCNLRCPLCPTGNGELRLSREWMTRERLKAVLDAAPRSIDSVTLFNWGEPLLNPDIAGLIEEASGRGLQTSVSTNLSLPAFGADDAARLVRSGLSELTISCDGASEETYRQYRVGGSFALVMRNLSLLLEAKRRLSRALPRIVWRFLVHDGNRHEIAAAERSARELGVPIRFKPLVGAERLRAGKPPELSEAPATPAGPPTLDEDYGALCLQSWHMPAVHSDGSVMPCCLVSDPRHSLGNVLTEPFERVWNAPLAMAMRRYLRTGARPDAGLPCYGCPFDPHRARRQ